MSHSTGIHLKVRVRKSHQFLQARQALACFIQDVVDLQTREQETFASNCHMQAQQ